MTSEVKLYLGDCLEILPTLPGPVDAIITDLPYGTTACSWDVVIPFVPMWEQVKRLLKPNGAFVTTASQPFTSMLVMSNLKWFRYEWIWNKVNVTGFLDVHKRPMKKHENILVFSKMQSIYNPILNGRAARSYGRLRQGTNRYATYKGEMASDFKQGVGYPQSIIEFQRPTNTTDEDYGLHPSQKSLALYEYLILTYTNPGDTVLDFCFGSGTTGEACVRTGRNFIGCESSPEYYAIAEKRIRDAQLQIPMPLE